jgi:hypothetical protein
MNPDELQDILSNPAVSAHHKERVLQQIGERSDDPGTDLEAELLQAVRKTDLASVPYHDVRAFCDAHGFSVPARDLFERWLCTSDVGRKGIEKAAEYLRKHDFEEWDGAAREWEQSGWKSTGRLIGVLQCIADSPARGNYHSEETVQGANKFLVEMKRRAVEGQR